MEARLHATVEEFIAVAGPLLRRDPVGNTVELSALRYPSALADDVVLLSVVDGGEVIAAALQTPPFPLLTNNLSLDVINCVTTLLAERQPSLIGVRGWREVTLAFADAWRAATGAEARVELDERLHRLDRLTAPVVAGELRLGNPHDAELLVDWLDRFHAEAFGSVPPGPEKQHRLLERVWASGDRVVLWQDGGEPVSLAIVRGPVASVFRIGPVFTPVDRRGHGYGSAVTAAAARFAVDDGAGDVVLFTDLANPVSNAIYARIGFVAVADTVRIGFFGPG